MTINSMLTPYRPQFIESIITDPFGRCFRVVFVVSYVGDHARGRIVSATPIEVLNGALVARPKTTLMCLSGCKRGSHQRSMIDDHQPAISPYFSITELLLTSQPTRAPAFVRSASAGKFSLD